VVVVGGRVVVDGVVLPSELDFDVGVVVGVVGVVVGDEDVEVVEVCAGVVPLERAAELAPGCSLATTTPIRAVAPVAARAAERVRRRSLVLARSRLSAELRSVGSFTRGRPLWLPRRGGVRIDSNTATAVL
jgi:hypothetical protein